MSDESHDERIIFSGFRTYYINFFHVAEMTTTLRKIVFYNFSLQLSITGEFTLYSHDQKFCPVGKISLANNF